MGVCRLIDVAVVHGDSWWFMVVMVVMVVHGRSSRICTSLYLIQTHSCFFTIVFKILLTVSMLPASEGRYPSFK